MQRRGPWFGDEPATEYLFDECRFLGRGYPLQLSPPDFTGAGRVLDPPERELPGRGVIGAATELAEAGRRRGRRTDRNDPVPCFEPAPGARLSHGDSWVPGGAGRYATNLLVVRGEVCVVAHPPAMRWNGSLDNLPPG